MPIRLMHVVAEVLILACASAAVGQLTYVERSSGLRPPSMEGGSTELEFGDVNADGHVDIVSIGDHGSPHIGTDQHGVMVWLGDGTGQWSVRQTGDFGYGGVALGDVNNDGVMDVGYGMHHDYSGTDFGNQLIEVALGDGSAQNWTPWDDGLATAGETWGMFGTDFADVDNDGDLDLGSVSFGAGAGLHVYLNNGDGTWTHSFGFTGGNSNLLFEFGDVNGDGNMDFAATHQSGTVYIGDGQGSFTRDDGNLPAMSVRRGISLGDVNNDGRDDLAYVTSAYGLHVWTWVGPGEWENLSGTLPASGSYRYAQIADMNLDGNGDVAAFATGEPGYVRVFAGDGAGNWEEIAETTLLDNCGYAAFRAGTDVDNNGFPDYAVIAEENCRIFVGGTNTMHLFVEDSTPTATQVYAASPRGGETLMAGSVRFLDWSAAVAEDPPPTMTIDLSVTGPDGPWLPVAADRPNNGRHQWSVPGDLTTSCDCHLRYSLGDVTAAVTPRPFTIVGEPRFGDPDNDCDVDLDDYVAFAECFTGIGGSANDSCEAVFDSDDDGDVDFTDFAAFQIAFGG